MHVLGSAISELIFANYSAIRVGRVAPHAGYVATDQLDGLIKLFLPTPVINTYAPSSTNRLALASAIPLEPPVMTSVVAHAASPFLVVKTELARAR
jgi:hypothetical protein